MKVYLSHASMEFNSGRASVHLERGNERIKLKISGSGIGVYRSKKRESLGGSRGVRRFIGGVRYLMGRDRKESDEWDISAAATIRFDSGASREEYLKKGSLTRTWDPVLEPDLDITVDGTTFRPSTWPAFEFNTQGQKSIVSVQEERASIEVWREGEKVMDAHLVYTDIDRFSWSAESIDWRELVWRRYGTSIGFWIERELDRALDTVDDPCIDSHRVCEVGVIEEEVEYDKSRGCCGSHDETIEHDSGRVFKIGFNYGH